MWHLHGPMHPWMLVFGIQACLNDGLMPSITCLPLAVICYLLSSTSLVVSPKWLATPQHPCCVLWLSSKQVRASLRSRERETHKLIRADIYISVSKLSIWPVLSSHTVTTCVSVSSQGVHASKRERRTHKWFRMELY